MGFRKRHQTKHTNRTILTMAWFDHWRWLLFPKVSKFALCATFDETGVTQATDRTAIHIGWNQVTEIYGYKKDCFSVDQLRIEILAPGKNILCVEDEQSFAEAEKLIALHLPDSLPDWHQKLVSSPAFELTWTQIYPVSSHVP